MTDEDSDRYSLLLGKVLERHGLAWITVEVNETFILGKEVKVPTGRGNEASEIEFRRTQFDAREKLNLLLGALERVLVSAAFMQAETIRNLKSDGVQVQFISEDNAQPVIQFSHISVTAPTQIADNLLAAITQIRELP